MKFKSVLSKYLLYLAVITIAFILYTYFLRLYKYSPILENFSSSSDDIIKNLKKNIIAEVRPSKIQGVGLFALTKLKPNRIVFEDSEVSERHIPGFKIKNSFTKKYQRDYIDKIFDYKNSGYYLRNRVNLVPITTYINHSNKPNIKWDRKNNYWITLDTILPNQEILSDYTQTNDMSPHYHPYIKGGKSRK
tara:strand:+ start:160 stop:732 length:573 start_codon:yes stop_codon:yes gene_type:complete